MDGYQKLVSKEVAVTVPQCGNNHILSLHPFETCKLPPGKDRDSFKLKLSEDKVFSS